MRTWAQKIHIGQYKFGQCKHQFTHGFTEQLRHDKTDSEEPLVKAHHNGVIYGLFFLLNETNVERDNTLDFGRIQRAIYESNTS